MSFTLFHRGSECPICHSSSGKCRKAEDLILCMGVTQADEVPGYKFKGITANQLWGKWIVQDGDSTEADREARKEQQRLKREQRAAEEAQKRAAAMPASERDRHYRRLLAQLTLHPDDRADLHRRGITDEQIKLWGIKSVERWQRLSIELPHTLPGVSLDGRSLSNYHAGYLVPIESPSGKITGFQIANRDRSGDTPKYPWLTSKTAKRENGQQPNLPNGELPLTVALPSNWNSAKAGQIGLCEGTGVKPRLAADKTSIPVIGASGGNFIASSELLKQYLQEATQLWTLQQKLTQRSECCSSTVKEMVQSPSKGAGENTSNKCGNVSNTSILAGQDTQMTGSCGSRWIGTEIIFFPDAGSPFNKNVLRQYRSVWKLLQRWGYTVRVAWWHQEAKDAPDIDELQDLQAIDFLTVAQWEGIVAGHDKQKMLDRIHKLFHRGRHKQQQQHQQQQQPEGDVFEYALGDRLSTWKHAQDNGSRYILDLSQTGSGKSYDSGNADPEMFGARQLIYVSNQHRNPTTDTLEPLNGWIDLEARHAGLVREATGGGARLRRAKRGEFATATIAANCSRTNLLGALRSKNVQGADTASMICGSCPVREACTHAEGRGYGYLNQRRSALSSPKLRSHPDSLPDPSEYNFEDVALLWDEPGETLNVKHTVSVTLNDLQQTITTLLLHPNFFEQLQPSFTALLSYLDGSASTGKFGLSHDAVLAVLPDVAGVDIGAIERALMPSFGFLNTTSEYGVDLADLPPHLRKKFADRDSELAEQAEGSLVKNWLPDLLRIVAGRVPGATLGLHHKTLTLTLPDARHRAAIDAAKAVIFLDATLSREDLALKLGCKPEEIFVCRQKQQSVDNLRIIQVTDLGRMGMNRGEDQKRRAAAIVAHFQQQDSTTRVIDFKKFVEDGSGVWWRDSRGVNDFLNCKTLILIGTPCQNLADLQAEYSTLTGTFPKQEDEGFRAYVDRKIRADILQAIGRPRADRRPDELITIVIISDFDLGLPNVEQVEASDITVEAAGKFERFQIAAKQAIETLKGAGEKLTQTAVAAISGYSQQYVSRHWKLLQTLLDLSNSKSSKASELDSDLIEIAEIVDATLAESPPDVVIQALEADLYEWIAPSQWSDIWQHLSQRAQISLVSALLVALNDKLPVMQMEAIG